MFVAEIGTEKQRQRYRQIQRDIGRNRETQTETEQTELQSEIKRVRGIEGRDNEKERIITLWRSRREMRKRKRRGCSSTRGSR